MRKWYFDDIVCGLFIVFCIVFFTVQIVRWWV